MPRQKKPTELKILQGTFQKCRAVDEEPTFDEADISAPDYMDGLALLTWQDLAPKLSKARVLKETDLRALESYCYTYENFRKSQEILSREGPVIVSDNGDVKKNPAATAVNEALQQLRMYSGILGLDPVSRTRINVGSQEKKGNPFTELQRSSARKKRD